jgi:hypothetical protein
MSEISLRLFQDSELLPVLLTCLIAILAVFIIFRLIPKKKNDKEKVPESSLSFVRPSRHFAKYTSRDWFLILIITIPYAIVSFWQLGSTVFPTSTWQPSSDGGVQSVILELTDQTRFSAIYTIYGDADNTINPDYLAGTTGMVFAGSNDGENWTELTTISGDSIYEYKITAGEWDYKYVKISSIKKTNTLTEVGFRNEDETGFLSVKVYQDDYSSSSYPASLMIDEQEKLILHPTYVDESYFDEIYHPRNAWEIATNHIMYATVHPLVGTNLIALSIKLFGMNTLAWRLPGAITGVLIVPLIYAIALSCCSKRGAWPEQLPCCVPVTSCI